jgi:phospholipid/cholesterol/gamma-HCH transport system substrate-binding protein
MEPRFVIKSPLIAMGSDVILQPGDTITETESALDIEELISKYAFGDV